MSDLLQHQLHFADLVGQFLTWCTIQGHHVTLGEAWRPPFTAHHDAEVGTGIANSLHCDRLALDVNLFVEGVYQTDAEPYRVLGEYWESLDPNAKWGGRFAKPDPDHLSLSVGDGRA